MDAAGGPQGRTEGAVSGAPRAAVLGLAAWVAGCGAQAGATLRTGPGHPGHPDCPAGTAAAPGRLARVWALLAADAEAAALGRALPVVCFGSGPGTGVLSGGVAVLDGGDADGDAGLSARLAHLLVHRRDGLGDGCAAGVEAALASEARAAAIEARLRRVLGLVPLEPGPPEADARADYLRRCGPP